MPCAAAPVYGNLTNQMTSSDPSSLPLMRREYSHDTLDESELAADPVQQFRIWFDEAQDAGIGDVNSMTLATSSAAGAVSARIVLLKEFDHRGFVFYTNYLSRKSRDLGENPRASMVFFWLSLERQVRIDGIAERVSAAESDAYFRMRPRAAQIGAWASNQSGPIDSRATLEKRAADVERRFAGQDIPRPDYWGGFRVAPTAFEFWQGRESRLHDRLVYLREGDKWVVRRLEP